MERNEYWAIQYRYGEDRRWWIQFRFKLEDDENFRRNKLSTIASEYGSRYSFRIAYIKEFAEGDGEIVSGGWR